jgi:TBC1 domain family protein 5
MKFFQEKAVLKILSTVLLVWCKHNPDVSYGQGMNEILASILYAYFQETFIP